MFAQNTVDAGLIAFPLWAMILKPINQIRIQAQRDLFFDGTVKQPALTPAPIRYLWNIIGINLLLWQGGQSL